MLAAAVVWLAFLAGLGGDDPLASLAQQLDGDLAQPFELTSAGGQPSFDKAGAYGALSDFARRLERSAVDPERLPAHSELVRDAVQLVRSVGGLVNQGPDFALETWAAGFSVALDDYEASLAAVTDQAGTGETAQKLLRDLHRFGERAVEAGLFIALADARSEPHKQALAPIAARAPAGARAAVEELLK